MGKIDPTDSKCCATRSGMEVTALPSPETRTRQIVRARARAQLFDSPSSHPRTPVTLPSPPLPPPRRTPPPTSSSPTSALTSGPTRPTSSRTWSPSAATSCSSALRRVRHDVATGWVDATNIVERALSHFPARRSLQASPTPALAVPERRRWDWQEGAGLAQAGGQRRRVRPDETRRYQAALHS